MHASPEELCIHHLLKRHAEEYPRAVAITSPGRTPLTYGQLFSQVEAIAGTLNAMGIGRDDCVAVVLTSGPEMAVALLAIASSARCAPFNPAYRERRFELCFPDLKPKALIIEAGLDSPAIRLARQHGVPIVTLSPALHAEAGIFKLNGCAKPRSGQSEFADPEDVALVLYTSGTTSQPKRVSLTHKNLLISADNVRAALSLDAGDRCLNVMPLYHIHGLVGAVLSSLAAGASVIVAPNFDNDRFFDWIDDLQPTWYTAVPTIHQAVLGAAKNRSKRFRHCPLRFIRSSSAPLPAKVMAELEEVFNVPVIEAYGMTEAAHQIASNPLPPKKRKPGSVGVAAGPKVAIMDETGNLLAPGEIGEIVLQGENLFRGYEDDSDADENAFTKGWFRTGDQGFLDSEGYLFITGRLKDVINRGGAKISPREIDDVLMSHPAVMEAVTFPLPHATLGEEVAAAVVLHKAVAVNQKEILEHVAGRVADFKVPRRLLIVDELPKTSTGKLQRNHLAATLGLASPRRPRIQAPRDQLETRLTEIWERILDIHPIGLQDNFFELGGDSLRAMSLVRQIEKTCHKSVPVAAIFQASTVEQLAEVLRREVSPARWSSLVAIQPKGSRPPFFWVHGENSTALLPRYLGPDQPLYGLMHQGQDGRRVRYTTIEEIANHYLEEIQSVQPTGVFYLGGYCTGGLVAFEMARQLQKLGQNVALLVLLDSTSPGSLSDGPNSAALQHSNRSFRDGASHQAPDSGELASRQTPTQAPHQAKRGFHGMVEGITRIAKKGVYKICLSIGYPLRSNLRYLYLADVYRKAAKQYVGQPYPGSVMVLESEDHNGEPQRIWEPLAAGGIEIHEVPGKHTEIVFKEAQIEGLAKQLSSCLDRAQAKATAAHSAFSVEL